MSASATFPAAIGEGRTLGVKKAQVKLVAMPPGFADWKGKSMER
jgi:hypothetical protein